MLKYLTENKLIYRFRTKLIFLQNLPTAGDFRKSDKDIGVQLKILLDDTKYWIENKTDSPDEIAIRFKHRIVSIHCFPNGNGRHSRIMADIIIESIFGQTIFNWGNSNLTESNQTRKEYIDAIRKADEGIIEPLLNFARK